MRLLRRFRDHRRLAKVMTFHSLYRRTTARSGRRSGWVSGDELPVDEPAAATGQAPTR